MNRRRAIGLLAAGAITPAFGNVTLAQTRPKRGGVLRVVMPTNPGSLDPLTGGQGTEHIFLFPMFDTLIAWDFQTLAAKPLLATDWNYPDPKTLVLNLRQGVTFHDGTPFDSVAVKTHLDRARNDPQSAAKGDLTSISEVEAPTPFQIILRLNQPDSALPLILSDRPGMISSPKAVAAGGDGYKRAPVGTGPWKFVRWVENEVISVTRNERYWGEQVPLDGIDFKIITDPNTAARSVIAGENDFAYKLFPQQKVVADRAGKTVQINAPTLATYHVAFNLSRPVLQNVKVRLAINYAIDRDAFNKVTQLGLGIPAHTMLPPGYWAQDDRLNNYYPHDPVKARQLLAEAGYPNGIDLQLFGYIDQSSQQRNEMLIEQLRQANIRVQLTAGINADINSRFYAKSEGDINLTTWTGRADPSQTYQLMFSQSGYTNPGHLPPTEDVQKGLNDVRASSDQEQRRQAFFRLEKAVLENALVAELFFSPEIDILSPKVKGFVPNVLGKPKFNDVWLDT